MTNEEIARFTLEVNAIAGGYMIGRFWSDYPTEWGRIKLVLFCFTVGPMVIMATVIISAAWVALRWVLDLFAIRFFWFFYFTSEYDTLNDAQREFTRAFSERLTKRRWGIRRYFDKKCLAAIKRRHNL